MQTGIKDIYFIHCERLFLLWAQARVWQGDFSRGMWKPRRAKRCTCPAWCVQQHTDGYTECPGEEGYSGDEDKAHFGHHSILSLGIWNLPADRWGKFLNGAKGISRKEYPGKARQSAWSVSQQEESGQRKSRGGNYSRLSSGLQAVQCQSIQRGMFSSVCVRLFSNHTF